MKKLCLVALLPLTIWGADPERPDPELLRTFSEMRDLAKTLRDRLQQHRVAVDRETKILFDLLKVAGDLSTTGASMAIDRARRDLDAAKDEAEAAPPASDAALKAIGNQRDVLADPSAPFNARRTRDLLLAALRPLEEQLVGQTKAIEMEVSLAQQLASSLESAALPLRGSEANALRAARTVREEALK